MRRSYAIAILLLVAGCAGHQQFHYPDGPLTSRQRDAALKALLGEEEYTEYVLLADTSEAADWLRRFWIKHDPTPTTSKNEFQEEHQRRVRHAIYFFGQPGKAGPPWDERGEVYIRYGEPNERRILQHGVDDNPYTAAERDRASGRVFGGGVADATLNDGLASTEVWTYYKFDQAFQFEDQQGWGYYKMVPVTDPTLRRQDVAEYYNSRLSISDLQPAIYYHEYGHNLVDYALDVVRFHTGDNLWRVDINLGYPLSELGRGEDSTSVSLRRTIVIRDAQQNEVYGEVGVIHRIVDTVTTRHRLMVEQKICELHSGTYDLAVTIDDLFSGKTGTYTKQIQLPKYIVSEVHEISDVELASFVWTMYEPGSPFVKAGRMVMPLPSRVYLPGQPLAFYYEVYNLLVNPDGETRYKVTYDIDEIGSDKSFHFSEPGVFSGSARDSKLFGTLEIENVPPGDYLLTINVQDLVGKHDKTTVARFQKSG